MNGRDRVTSLFGQFAGQQAMLVIPRPFIDLCQGDILAALLLSQILYWSDRTKDDTGWFAKSYEDWHSELALTDKQVKRIISGDKRRKDVGFALETVGIETKLARSDFYQGAATLHYRVNYDILTAKINELSQVSTIGGNHQCGKPPIAENDDPTIAENDHIHRLRSKTIELALSSDSTDTKEEKPKRQRSPKQLALDGMKNAIADAFDLDHDKVTGTQWSEFSKAGKELLEAGATPTDMKPLHAYCKANCSVDFTSMYMSKQWAKFSKSREGVQAQSSTVKSQDTRAALYEVTS